MIVRGGNLDVLREAEDHWYKIAGILLHRLLTVTGQDVRAKVLIKESDIEAFANLFPGDVTAVIYHPRNDTITLQLLPLEEAKRKVVQ